jgi:hypothetical protein
MIRSASITHRTPGRIRIRIPSAKGDSEFLEQVRTALASLPGVMEVTCSPLTGSLLVFHPPEVELELERTLTARNGTPLPFVLQPDVPSPTAKPHQPNRKRVQQSLLANAVAETMAELDDAVGEATGISVDLKILAPLAAAGFGFSLVGRNRITPLWLTLLMFAFSTFLDLHQPQSGPTGDGAAGLSEQSSAE